MKTKLRAHFHFSVKSQRQYLQQIYGIDHIRAVLVETLDENRLEELRSSARTRVVSGRPNPLFWFTATEFLEGPDEKAPEPLYLSRPDIILKAIWLSPLDDTLHSLSDP